MCGKWRCRIICGVRMNNHIGAEWKIRIQFWGSKIFNSVLMDSYFHFGVSCFEFTVSAASVAVEITEEHILNVTFSSSLSDNDNIASIFTDCDWTRIRSRQSSQSVFDIMIEPGTEKPGTDHWFCQGFSKALTFLVRTPMSTLNWSTLLLRFWLVFTKFAISFFAKDISFWSVATVVSKSLIDWNSVLTAKKFTNSFETDGWFSKFNFEFLSSCLKTSRMPAKSPFRFEHY